jgi:hypothetical protein
VVRLEVGVESFSIELNARKLQLLAIDALLEHARTGTRSADSSVKVLQRIVDLGLRLDMDSSAVRIQELSEAEAEVLCMRA